MVKNKIIDESKYDVYAYGLELLIAYVCYFIIFYLLAFLTGTFWESTFFCVGFMILRKFGGGFHASTYLKCHALFAANHLLFIALIRFMPAYLYNALLFLIPLIAAEIIWAFAPVEHENRPFNSNEYLIFRKRSRIYSVVIILIAAVFFRFSSLRQLLMSYLLGVFSAALSIFAGSIQAMHKDV